MYNSRYLIVDSDINDSVVVVQGVQYQKWWRQQQGSQSRQHQQQQHML